MLVPALLLLTLNSLGAHALPQEGKGNCKTVTVTDTVILDPTTVFVAPSESASKTSLPVPAPPSPTPATEPETVIISTITIPAIETLRPAPSLSSAPFGNQTEVVVPSYPAVSPPSNKTTGTAPPLLPSSLSLEATLEASSSTIEEPAPTTAEEPTSSAAASSSPSSPTTQKKEEPSATASGSPNNNDSDSSPIADATRVADSPAATQMCGDSDRKIMPGYPWTVSNAMYNAGQMVGQQCTNYEDLLESSEGLEGSSGGSGGGTTTQYVRYTSVTDIERVGGTEDVCKGYSNVGIGKNLERRFGDVKGIPAYFQWERAESDGFKGANIFDFITAPAPGDASSASTAEFMLWLEIWGGQVPIGYSRGPVAALDLFGAAFDLYEGQNPSSGVTVRSALPTTGSSSSSPFGGVFRGDLKDWLDAMAARGYIRDADYVNVGNAGTEVFYGSSEMKAVVALEIVV